MNAGGRRHQGRAPQSTGSTRVPAVHLYTRFGAREDKSDVIAAHLPQGSFRRIVIKPNWVMHETDGRFPIEALVTSAVLIDAVIEACLSRYPDVEQITIADAPLQSCDWQLLIRQSGIDRLMTKYGERRYPRIRFLDLRAERFVSRGGFLVPVRDDTGGDPLGYQEIELGSSSFLEPISRESNAFRVADYDPRKLAANHAPGTHRYLVSSTVLASDLLINVPKMKTHQKSGLTGALKNLVGINGDKAFLVHYRTDRHRGDGDEFPPSTPLAVMAQVRVREALQKRRPWLFALGRMGWKVLKRVSGIHTEGTNENLGRAFYVSGGSWYGNGTIWRMIYDLNLISCYAPAQGVALESTPQRRQVVIVDGLVSGEGNGPLQPLPVRSDVVLVSDDAFLADLAIARLMGFDHRKLPLLANYELFFRPSPPPFDPDQVEIELDGCRVHGIAGLPISRQFIPAPGWKGHVELEDGAS